MDTDLIAKLVLAENPDLPQYLLMEKINEYSTNFTQNRNNPFTEVDIRFSEYLHFFDNNATQRERDMVTVTEKFYSVWKTLHISLQVLKEDLKPYEVQEITMLSTAMHRLGIENIILKGLQDKYVLLFKEANQSEAKKEDLAESVNAKKLKI